MHFAFVLAKHKPGLEATNGVSSVKISWSFLFLTYDKTFQKWIFKALRLAWVTVQDQSSPRQAELLTGEFRRKYRWTSTKLPAIKRQVIKKRIVN